MVRVSSEQGIEYAGQQVERRRRLDRARLEEYVRICTGVGEDVGGGGERYEKQLCRVANAATRSAKNEGSVCRCCRCCWLLRKLVTRFHLRGTGAALLSLCSFAALHPLAFAHTRLEVRCY